MQFIILVFKNHALLRFSILAFNFQNLCLKGIKMIKSDLAGEWSYKLLYNNFKVMFR